MLLTSNVIQIQKHDKLDPQAQFGDNETMRFAVVTKEKEKEVETEQECGQRRKARVGRDLARVENPSEFQ